MKILLFTVITLFTAQGWVWAQNTGNSKIPGADGAPRLAPPTPAAASAPGQLGREALPSASDYSSQILPEIKGVVSWKTLAQVMPVKQKDRFVPQFSDTVAKLDKTEVKLQGFMMPLDMGENQKRFILAAVPSSCSFCLPAGPDAMIEVRAKTSVKFGFEPIVLTGKFAVLKDDPAGLYYRLTDAEAISIK
jgi:uncharacterized protein